MNMEWWDNTTAHIILAGGLVFAVTRLYTFAKGILDGYATEKSRRHDIENRLDSHDKQIESLEHGDTNMATALQKLRDDMTAQHLELRSEMTAQYRKLHKDFRNEVQRLEKRASKGRREMFNKLAEGQQQLRAEIRYEREVHEHEREREYREGRTIS